MYIVLDVHTHTHTHIRFFPFSYRCTRLINQQSNSGGGWKRCAVTTMNIHNARTTRTRYKSSARWRHQTFVLRPVARRPLSAAAILPVRTSHRRKANIILSFMYKCACTQNTRSCVHVWCIKYALYLHDCADVTRAFTVRSPARAASAVRFV